MGFGVRNFGFGFILFGNLVLVLSWDLKFSICGFEFWRLGYRVVNFGYGIKRSEFVALNFGV